MTRLGWLYTPLVICLAGCSIEATTPVPSDARGDSTKVSALGTSLLNEAGLPGLSVAFRQNGDRIAGFTFGDASADRTRPLREDTPMRAASLSKLFAATAALVAINDGLLDPDEPISSYVPDFPGSSGITVRMLAGHLSGLPHYEVDATPEERRYDSIDDALKVFMDAQRVGPPGAQYEYSTHGFTLLAAVIEKASGRLYADYLEENVLAPLDLTHTGLENETVFEIRQSELFRFEDGQLISATPNDQSYSWGGAGLVTTAVDLVRLSRAYENGFLRPTLVDSAFVPLETSRGQSTGVGFGWRIGSDVFGNRIVHHAGFGNGARAALLYYYEDSTATAVMTNVTWRSVIESTTAMFHEAYFEGDSADEGVVFSGDWSGTWNGAEEFGSLDLVGTTGRISTAAGMHEILKRVDQPRSDLPLIHLHSDVWALVTPIGVFKAVVDGTPSETQMVIEVGVHEWRLVARQ